MTSGIKTYVNFPFAKSDGEVTEKGKRLADSSTGSSIKKDYELDASIDMTVPGGFALDVQAIFELIFTPIVQCQGFIHEIRSKRWNFYEINPYTKDIEEVNKQIW